MDIVMREETNITRNEFIEKMKEFITEEDNGFSGSVNLLFPIINDITKTQIIREIYANIISEKISTENGTQTMELRGIRNNVFALQNFRMIVLTDRIQLDFKKMSFKATQEIVSYIYACFHSSLGINRIGIVFTIPANKGGDNIFVKKTLDKYIIEDSTMNFFQCQFNKVEVFEDCTWNFNYTLIANNKMDNIYKESDIFVNRDINSVIDIKDITPYIKKINSLLEKYYG